jgi:hypothetical protein
MEDKKVRRKLGPKPPFVVTSDSFKSFLEKKRRENEEREREKLVRRVERKNRKANKFKEEEKVNSVKICKQQ